jgi:hypothetical protein
VKFIKNHKKLLAVVIWAIASAVNLDRYIFGGASLAGFIASSGYILIWVWIAAESAARRKVNLLLIFWLLTLIAVILNIAGRISVFSALSADRLLLFIIPFICPLNGIGFILGIDHALALLLAVSFGFCVFSVIVWLRTRK